MITLHKPQAFKLGFTLSELLVSLAILGLIAGLTVPSILVSIDRRSYGIRVCTVDDSVFFFKNTQNPQNYPHLTPIYHPLLLEIT